jgi:Spy/CpxP family protein refolding chaperone
MKHILPIASAVILAAGSLGAFAGGPEGKKGPNKIMKELKLSEEQKEKMKELRDQNKDAQKELFGKITELRGAIKEELLKDDPDENALSSLAAQLGEFHARMAKAHQDRLLEIKKILTKEQFEKLLQKEPFGQGGMQDTFRKQRPHRGKRGEKEEEGDE